MSVFSASPREPAPPLPDSAQQPRSRLHPALVTFLLLIGLNLLVDFAYTLLDPRVNYE